MSHNDIDIIQGCRKRKPDFQRLLVEKYATILMTVARRYARTFEEAEDVLQDAFVKIFERIDQFNSEKGTLQSWMRSIVIRTALRDYRRKFPSLGSLDLFVESEKPLPENIISKLTEEEILKVISKLPNGFRQVFNLYVIDGYSHREIGELLGISESTSRSQLTRAKKMLRKSLSHYQTHEICRTTALAMILELS